ncbi:MAG: ferritin-like fold-containing protein [Angustibacter sp.]
MTETDPDSSSATQDVVATAAAHRPDHAVDPFDDPGYRAAVVDLLAVMAYGELTAFHRIAADLDLAPTLPDKEALGRQAVTEFAHYELLATRLSELGVDVAAAVEPFVAAVDDFHERTRPSTWLEGLVKAYVGDGIAADFFREVASALDADTRALVLEVLQDLGQADVAVRAVREAVEADPAVAGRLALWGRRLVGEALSQAQRVAAERDSLAALLIGEHSAGGSDLAEVGRMLARITDEHSRRMERLSLAS